MNVTDCISYGYISSEYSTDPNGISFEFFVEPSSGIALETKFMLSVTT